MTTDDRFEISTSTPLPLRIGLGAVGAFIAFMVTKDLWRGVWPLSILTPLFLIILGGGTLVGVTLIAAMIWGPDERWAFAPGTVTITRSLRKFRSEKTYTATDILSADVAVNPSDGGPDTYELLVKLTMGKTLCSPNFAQSDRAEAARCLLMGTRA